ncbi:MAG: DUF1592 domain-containing protein [Rubripirellula sp.]|nr:DUF1592 domain-containing protein [Rubripirellula sp.]
MKVSSLILMLAMVVGTMNPCVFSQESVAQESASKSEDPRVAAREYKQDIQPLLSRHCIDCHGAEEQEGMLRLDALDSTFAGASAETWHDVLNRLNLGEMPPEDAAPIDAVSRRTLVNWIRDQLDRVALERKGNGNQTVLRRLTRYEYRNTLRDLLGIDLDFAKDLPPEPSSADGFQNNGVSLGMSALQIEYYLKAARLAMDKVIVEGDAPEVYRHRFDATSSTGNGRNRALYGNRMLPQGRFLGRMLEFPREGDFVVRVKAGAVVPDGMGVPRMRVAMGLRSDTQSPAKILGEIDVRNPETDQQVYEFRGRIEEFPLPGHNPKFPGITITLFNVYDDGIETPKPEKFKAIALNRDQKKQVSAAVKDHVPGLPLPPSVTKKNKAVAALQQVIGKLQRQIEELRLLSPEHKNQTDLAYRLFDIEVSRQAETRLIEDLANKDLQEDPQAFLSRYRKENVAALADRDVVLRQFQAIKPIDRKSKQLVAAKSVGPPRTTLVVDYLEFEGPIYGDWPPRHHTRLLPPSKAPERDRAQQAIASLMERAYRRPVTELDIAPVLDLYDEIRPTASSFEDAMRDSLAMVLVSPQFLYLFETNVDDSSQGNLQASDQDKSRQLSQYELASRLSYLLWSTMPDEQLMAVAKAGRLKRGEVMERQVRRMIADPRSENFVINFTSQWLDLSGLDRVAINPNYYPEFDESLKPMMKRETQAFVGEILRHDLSALNLIDSDFVMLNEPLAKHYGLATSAGSPRGGDFERVELRPEDQRGGLLTQGSFLMINSNGEDSHPIRRAVWVLDRLLDDPPAPPPPDVPELDSEQADFAKLPLKKQLEVHRTKDACNDCHRNIDPWGVAFESYDAVGLRRASVLRRVGKKTVLGLVDDVATLPNGAEIEGVEGLKTYLLQNDRDRFARALVSKLLAYGMGRTLIFEDRLAVEALVESFEQNDYRLSDLMVAIAQSEAFQNK